MAFWGAYVKPGDPYILKPDSEGRRLRITQATLGEQSEVELPRSVLQCAVGNNLPISVCSLSMKELHCCPLNLEFEELEDVMFSVVGPQGVYLAGAYLAQCAACTARDGANGFIIKYYDGKASEEAENLNDKRLSSTENGAESENGKTFTAEKVENEESKKLSRNEKAEDEKDRNRTTSEVVAKEKDKMLSEPEEDIGDTDSFVDCSLYGSEDNTYGLCDSFIDDGLSVQHPMQEILGVQDNDNMAQNVKPKNRKSSRKVLQKNLATESGGHNRSQQKGRTVKKLSLGINKGADYERELGGPLGRGKRDKFNHCTESGEPESGLDANFDVATKEHYLQGMPSQRKRKRNEKSERKKEGLSGDIVIEELAKGKPDGKIAVQGRKVKIMYTAWVKETGKVIGSNIGEAPFKFQLGDEEIIKGWNVGVDGMRVGDKRRVILPPSMGSWKVDETTIPPNSYLVYDIELIGVH